MKIWEDSPKGVQSDPILAALPIIECVYVYSIYPCGISPPRGFSGPLIFPEDGRPRGSDVDDGCAAKLQLWSLTTDWLVTLAAGVCWPIVESSVGRPIECTNCGRVRLCWARLLRRGGGDEPKMGRSIREAKIAREDGSRKPFRLVRSDLHLQEDNPCKLTSGPRGSSKVGNGAK